MVQLKLKLNDSGQSGQAESGCRPAFESRCSNGWGQAMENTAPVQPFNKVRSHRPMLKFCQFVPGFEAWGISFTQPGLNTRRLRHSLKSPGSANLFEISVKSASDSVYVFNIGWESGRFRSQGSDVACCEWPSICADVQICHCMDGCDSPCASMSSLSVTRVSAYAMTT